MPVPNACALSYTLNNFNFNSFCCLAAIFLSGRTTESTERINKRKSFIILYLFCHDCNEKLFFFFLPPNSLQDSLQKGRRLHFGSQWHCWWCLFSY